MKIKRSQLKNYLRKSLLKEFVPGPVQQSPSVSAEMKELERVSKIPSEGGSESGGFYFRFDDNNSIGKETVTVPFKNSKSTKDSLFDSALKIAKNWTPSNWAQSFYADDYASISLPGAFDAPDEGGDVLESEVERWAPGYFLYNSNANDRKIAEDPKFDGNITILGTYVPNYQTENGSVLIETQDPSHIVIRTQDVENLAKQAKWLLSEPCLPEDIANVDRIIKFLSGDSQAFQDVFGTGTSIASKAEQYVKTTANNIFKTKFDENKFSRNYGNRVVCAENDSDTSPLYDAVKYFNENFNSIVTGDVFRSPQCEYVENYPMMGLTGRSSGDDEVKYTEVGTPYNSNDIKNISEQRSSAIQKQLDGIKAVRDVIDYVPINPNVNKKASDFLISLGALTTLLNSIKNRYDKTLTVNSEASGFNNISEATAISNVRRSVQTSNESFVNRRGKSLLTEALAANAIDEIINNWFNQIGPAQRTPGLEDEVAAMTNGSVTAQFFTSDNQVEPKYSEEIIAGTTPTEAQWVSAQFIEGLRRAKVFEITEIALDEAEPGTVFASTLVIKNATDIAYFIKLPGGNYLSPFEITSFKTEMEKQLRTYLTAFEVDQFQIGDRVLPVQGVEPAEADAAQEEETVEEVARDKIDPPNYDANVKGLVRQLERIVNAYNDSIKETDKMTVDGKWEGSEDSAWGSMVDHAMGDAGKSPAKGSGVTVTSISNDWKQAGKDLVRQGLKGYTNNAAGALAFAYDAYTNGEDVKNGHKRPVSSRRPASSSPSTRTEPEKKTSVSLPSKKAKDLTINITGNLANNKNIESYKTQLQKAIVNALPTGKKVNKETSLKINTRTGGGVQSLRSNLQGLDKQGLEAQIRKIIKGPVGAKTRGTIDVTVPAGIYTLNESTVNSLAALIQELVKQK